MDTGLLRKWYVTIRMGVIPHEIRSCVIMKEAVAGKSVLGAEGVKSVGAKTMGS